MRVRAKEREPRASGAPKIIVQYRAKAAKVYELQSNGAVVAVRISQGEVATIASGWHIDAQSDCTRGLSVIEGRGTTAAEALTAVARAWTAHFPPLTAFDWEAIARELHVVQAI
jgi:hypothetical protein